MDYREYQKMLDPAYLKTVSMNEIYETVFESRTPLIEGLLYSGTYLFVGAPKLGKSFFMAQLAYHISTGIPLWNYPVRKGTVLYLALEDDYRRLQERMYRMFGTESTDSLFFATSANQLGKGLDEQLQGFIREHPDTRLIIIDTLQKVREAGGDNYSYANDYEIITRLNHNYSNKDIDLSRTSENYHHKKIQAETYQQEFERIRTRQELKGNLRLHGEKQSTILCEFVITSDKEFFDRLGKERTRQFFEDAYDFVTAKVGGEQYILSAVVRPMNNNTPYFWFTEFCKENNFRFCDIHSMRHFYASALINEGIDATTVSGALGHSVTKYDDLNLLPRISAGASKSQRRNRFRP